MGQNHGQLLLKDTEIRALLKDMILQKSDHYDSLDKEILTSSNVDSLLEGVVTQQGIKKILSSSEAQDEQSIVKRDLSAMCYSLNKSLDRIPHTTKWEDAYQYATQVVQIADVAADLLGLTNFRRNINCPFHEDKTPSCKIYTKNNYFVCFGCGARGSPIDFVMKYKNCPFKEAVLYLSNL